MITAIAGSVMVVAPQSAHAAAPMCWAITDDTPELFIFQPNTANPQPPTSVPLSQVFKGEGLAYRASTNSVALFSDGPSKLWYYDLDTNTETSVGANLPGHVDGSAFFTDPADPAAEELWVSIKTQLYHLDPNTAAIISGPHAVTGVAGTMDGMGFEPTLGTLWVTDDRPESVLYTVDLLTFAATKVADIRFSDGLKPDAESLDFAADGQMYTEEDEGDKRPFRYINEVDPATGIVTPAAGPVPGIGDMEGLACNSGVNAPAIDIEKFVNGDDADVAPGPQLDEGSTATFVYRVTNTGNTDLFDVVVTDDKGVVVTCPTGSATIPALLIGETVDCTGSGVVTVGQYTNIGAVTGHPRPPTNSDGTPGTPVTIGDSDPANYFGVEVVVVLPPTVPDTTVPTTTIPETTVATTIPVTTVPTTVAATSPQIPSTTRPIVVSLPPTGRPTVVLSMCGLIALLTGLTARRTARRVPARH